MKKVEQLEKALERATRCIQGLAELRHDTLIVDINQIANVTMKNINAILNPPPEYEEVEESAGWVNIYPAKETAALKTKVSHAYPTRSLADDNAKDTRIACEELKYKVTRPKPVPVERSVSGEVKWVHCEGFIYPVGKNIGFDWESIIGKTGHLTFVWTE